MGGDDGIERVGGEIVEWQWGRVRGGERQRRMVRQ